MTEVKLSRTKVDGGKRCLQPSSAELGRQGTEVAFVQGTLPALRHRRKLRCRSKRTALVSDGVPLQRSEWRVE